MLVIFVTSFAPWVLVSVLFFALNRPLLNEVCSSFIVVPVWVGRRSFGTAPLVHISRVEVASWLLVILNFSRCHTICSISVLGLLLFELVASKRFLVVPFYKIG